MYIRVFIGVLALSASSLCATSEDLYRSNELKNLEFFKSEYEKNGVPVPPGLISKIKGLSRPISKVDAGEFDVAGIKLGMSLNQAISILESKYDVDAKLFNQIFKESNEKFQFTYGTKSNNHTVVAEFKENKVTNSKEPITFVISAIKDKYQIQLGLDPTIPYNPNKKIFVNYIEYRLKNNDYSITEADKDNFRKMVIEKYGEPSTGLTARSGADQWCIEPVRHGSCDEYRFKGPVLTYEGTKLFLYDGSYTDRLREYERNIKTVNPNF